MPLKLSPTQVAFNARGDGSFNKPFAEQVAFFRQKLNLPTVHYDDIVQEAHNRAFVVAGAMKADLLNDLREAVDKAIADGKSIGAFRKEFNQIVKKHGWDGWTGSDSAKGRDWRTRVIYRTNLASSYAAGRWAQLNDPDLLKTRPYWKYVHNDTVQHPRPLHVSWSGMVLPHDHPWWQAHFPPNGWGCRCRVIAVRAKEYHGAEPPEDGVYTHKDRAGNNHVIPKGIDYGWDYAPGANGAKWRPDYKKYPPEIAKPLKNDIEGGNTNAYWQAGAPQTGWHDNSFNDAPTTFKNAIKQHDESLKGLESYRAHGAYYRRGTQTINMGKLSPDDYHGQGVWRHEYGHFIDHQKGSGYIYRSSRDDFSQLMKAETQEIRKASGYGRKSKANDAFLQTRQRDYQQLKSQLIDMDRAQRAEFLQSQAERLGLSLADFQRFMERETLHTEHSLARDLRLGKLMKAIDDRDAVHFMDAIYSDLAYKEKSAVYYKGLLGKFSDLIGSASKNKLLGHGPHGFGGHSNSYLKDHGQAETEVFANLMSLLGSGDAVWQQTINRFYPKLTQLFEAILNE